jgi:hypothetical protein
VFSLMSYSVQFTVANWSTAGSCICFIQLLPFVHSLREISVKKLPFQVLKSTWSILDTFPVNAVAF